MLDTVALTLDRHEFVVLRPEAFSPSAQGLLEPPYYPIGGRANMSCVLNPTSEDRRDGRYKPRLTLTRRIAVGGFATTLRVEFSAPKLLFGNNFDELRSQDFDAVVRALGQALSDLGVMVREDILRAARVSAVHFGKNIALHEFTTCTMALVELAKVDLTRRLDLSRTDFRDHGHAVRYHANRFEVAFYDKVKDLRKSRLSEKRAIERDNACQTDLLAASVLPKGLEVLRMEVRLGSRQKIMALLKELHPGAEPTFAAVFDRSLARKVLLHFWARVGAGRCPQAGVASRPEDVFLALAAARPAAKPTKVLQHLAASALLASVGWRGLAALVEMRAGTRSWQRLKREMKSWPATVGFSPLDAVAESLTRFEALRLQAFRAGVRTVA